MTENQRIAIVLAAGQGKRMESDVEKQYLEIHGKPLVYYSLETLERSDIIDRVILVVGKGQVDYVKNKIVDTYSFQKVEMITEGGNERYESVYKGLLKVKEYTDIVYGKAFVFIHDCARPFLTEDILKRTYEGVRKYGACVAGMLIKDTIKIVDEKEFAVQTPDRSRIWTIQTPQVFEYEMILAAYEKLMKQNDIQVTDDAMVVEQMMHTPVKMIEGSYRNIKITTPEDLDIAHVFLIKN